MNASRPADRRKFTAAQRDGFVRLYRQSAVTQAQFARTHRLKLGTLLRWLYRRPNPTRRSAPLFKEVLLSPQTTAVAHGIEIGVGRDITVRLGSAATPEFIAQLVRNLRPPC